MTRWLGPPLAVVVGVLVAMAAMVEYDRFNRALHLASREREPVTNWMIVHDLRVPTFSLGSEPEVVFQRSVFRDLTGTWTVEVHDFSGTQVCRAGSGEAAYSTAESKTVKLSFSAYTGGCILPSGGPYRVSVLIRLSDGIDGHRKPISFYSNWFSVRP